MGTGSVVKVAAPFVLAYWFFTCLHECIHIAAACLLGHARSAITLSNLVSATFSRHVHIPGVSGWRAQAVRHAGWAGSLLVAMSLSLGLCGLAEPWSVWRMAAWLTALDSMCSDLLKLDGTCGQSVFHCGNFGCILLSKDHRKKVLDILKEMVRITMMRGAQSGGVITYVRNGAKGVRGIRSRVVNGKRTDLSVLITEKLRRDQRWAPLIDGPRIYAGHTRFATTSKATFDGTHPHQWTPPEVMKVWRRSGEGEWTSKDESVENFICHNGDLDAFEIGKMTHPLESLMPWLECINHHPCPSPVDSCGVAGLVDLLRCQGVWYKAAKFGYVFGLHRHKLDHNVPPKSAFQAVAKVFDQAFQEALKEGHPPKLGRSAEDVKALFEAFLNPDRITLEQCRAYYKKIYKDKKSNKEIKDMLEDEIYDYDVNGDGNFARGKSLLQVSYASNRSFLTSLLTYQGSSTLTTLRFAAPPSRSCATTCLRSANTSASMLVKRERSLTSPSRASLTRT